MNDRSVAHELLRFVDPVIDARRGLREFDRTFFESYPPELLTIVERRLTAFDTGLRWITDLPKTELIRRVHERDHLVLAANRADDDFARSANLPVTTLEDYLAPRFIARDRRRNLAILNTDLVHQLMLSPDRLQRLVDRLDASLLLPVAVPLVEFTALWDAGWSGPRIGLFSHRRLNDLHRPAFITILSDGDDWRPCRLSMKIWSAAPSGVVFRIDAPQASYERELGENPNLFEASLWIRPGRTSLKISVDFRRSDAGGFIDVGDLQIAQSNCAQPPCLLRHDLDDDGTFLTASLGAALRRLHGFGFIGSRFDVYCRGSRMAAFSGKATTRMSDLSPLIETERQLATDDLGGPQRATAVINLLRAEQP